MITEIPEQKIEFNSNNFIYESDGSEYQDTRPNSPTSLTYETRSTLDVPEHNDTRKSDMFVLQTIKSEFECMKDDCVRIESTLEYLNRVSLGLLHDLDELRGNTISQPSSKPPMNNALIDVLPRRPQKQMTTTLRDVRQFTPISGLVNQIESVTEKKQFRKEETLQTLLNESALQLRRLGKNQKSVNTRLKTLEVFASYTMKLKQSEAKAPERRLSSSKKETSSINVKRRARVEDLQCIPVSSLFAVGMNEDGQCGLDSEIHPCPVGFKKVNTSDNENDPCRIQFSNIVCGGVVTLGITTEGLLYSWGIKEALGRTGKEWVPERIEFSRPVSIVAAACGECACAVLDHKGHVWSWGSFRDSAGKRRFNKNLEHADRPVRLNTPEPMTQLAAGESHFAALGISGTVYTWGNNEFCQLGHPFVEAMAIDDLKPRPALIDHSRIMPFNVCAAGFSTFILGNTGVWAFGKNGHGELGLGDSVPRPIPTPISEFSTKRITNIQGGLHHTLFLDDKGHVWGCGRNDDGQLGLSDSDEVVLTPSRIPFPQNAFITKIACGVGSHHSYAIDKDRNLYSTGHGDYGQLGHGSKVSLLRGFKQVPLKGRSIYDVSGGCHFTIALLSPRPQ